MQLPAFAALLVLAASGGAAARDPSGLSVLADRYPRAFFFRASESAASERKYPTYESWERDFDRLQGIMGKCLDEEVLGRELRNPEFYSRFKQRHPEQVVLLHFNGNARDPRYKAETYFPGHWIYRRATLIRQDVPAESGETVIAVEDASDFRVDTGRYRTSSDDIALFGIDADGQHDWDRCEQVQLVAVDREANAITVRRGCYGTKPLAFAAGRSRAAAHEVEGPWGEHNHLMWFYNFATHCPQDKDGKTCADRLVDDLAAWFGPAGKLADFDGLEFDVMFHATRGDTDGDGVVDDGVVDGINRYGIGVFEFARQLRQRMTDDFIIQGDGALGPGGIRSQRAWGLLNGIESEGWPNLGDWEFDDWSGGLNRQSFWRDNGRAPAFSYANHKWNAPVPGLPGGHRNPDVPFARHRLVFAACQFADAAICYSFAPQPDPDGRLGVWDELRKGVEHELGWLGRPEGPAVHLATRTPDLLGHRGSGVALAAGISGAVRAEATAAGVKVVPSEPDASRLRFTLGGVPADGSNLFVAVSMKADPMAGYPPAMARFATVGVSGGMLDLMAANPLSTGIRLRGADAEVELDRTTGASFQRRQADVDGRNQISYFVHPPYKVARGSVFWTSDALVPENAELQFSVSMGEKSPERSDGVWFQVEAAELSAAGVGSYSRIFETSSNRNAWLPQRVPLAAYAGRRVRFKFVADCGPQDNATTDHASWTGARIVAAGAAERITQPVERMTWVNDREFASGFYFRQIGSPSVDLAFEIEGGEPVTIQSIAAHAHPDAMYRVFEGGLVLANPSLEPYTFRLAEISPGRTYRRLRGTATQDAETNSGEAVGSEVTLGERDALFLVRCQP